MRNLIIGSIIVMVMVSLVGCAIHVIPLNDGRVPLPPATYGMEFNTYGSGWGWPFLYWPGVSWGQRSYYYGHYYGNYYGHYGYPSGSSYYGLGRYSYGWGPRYVPGYLKSVPGPNGIGRYIWVPSHYE